MPLVDLATAKRELHVLHDAEDEDIERKIAAAEEQAAIFLGRNVYEDQAALDSARAAAPAVLTAATATYNTALDAARAMESYLERDGYERLAKDTYNAAFWEWDRTMRGMVVTDSIRTAILLIAGSLWVHRGDEDAVEGIPPAARTFLWPYRTGVGV